MNYIDYNFGIMDTLKKAGSRALKGWDDGEKTSYGKNIALRAGEGTVIGAGGGAIAGNIAGRVKRHKAGQRAREEASKGTINKILNAINGDRLKNIEKEARKKVSLTKHTLAGMGIGAGTGAAAGASAGAIETYIKRNRAKNKARDERLLKLEEENKAERAAREKAEKDAERYKAQRGGVIPWAFRGVKKLAGKFMDWRAKKKKEWDDNHYTANDYWNDVGGGNPARFGMQHMSLMNYMTDRGYHEFSSRNADLYSDYNFGFNSAMNKAVSSQNGEYQSYLIGRHNARVKNRDRMTRIYNTGPSRDGYRKGFELQETNIQSDRAPKVDPRHALQQRLEAYKKQKRRESFGPRIQVS